MQAQRLSNGQVKVSLGDGEALAHMKGPAEFEIAPIAGLTLWDALAAEGVEIVDTPPVPDTVWDYQFAGEAEARGIITSEECDAWVGPGIVPETLTEKVKQIITDPAARRRVILFLKGSKEFPRYHPNTVALAALFGLDTSAKIDAFFLSAEQR